MQHIISNYSLFRVLDVFFQNPHKNYQLREISRIIKLDHKSVLNYLKKLIKETLVKKDTSTLYKSYKANINKRFTRLKKATNLLKIYESGLVDFIEKKTLPRSIVLYGTYAKGTDNINSDIDLFIESAQKKIDISKFEKKLKRKIHLLFEGKMSKEFKNNLINGVVLTGNMRLFK